MTLQVPGATDDPLGAMKQAERGELLRVRFLGLRAVGDPKQALGQLPAVEQAQAQSGQLGHQGLRRDPMRGEEVRDARRLIVGRSEDACAHRPELGFADKQTDEQVVKGVKDLSPQQRAETMDAGFECRW